MGTAGCRPANRQTERCNPRAAQGKRGVRQRHAKRVVRVPRASIEGAGAV